MSDKRYEDENGDRHGVIGVILRDDRFLIIKRSEHVRSPGMTCFPGGGMEAGETEPEALVREMQEELHVRVTPVRKVWQSRLKAGWQLHWWLAEIEEGAEILPDSYEVEGFNWMTAGQISMMPDLLSSNRDFFTALGRGEIHLDTE